MNPHDIDEDALDSEALQAQIDLSMSFAQGLVSTWMAPHKYPKNPRKKDLEKELTEYMRRPPRLGVGASVPEGHQSLSRETARLKGKLGGSKRSREEEEEVAAAKQSFDEEGESRAVAIKKKARPDLFDVVHGKKKKKQKMAEPVAVAASVSPSVATQTNNDSSGEVEDILMNGVVSPGVNGTNSVLSTPVKKKKKAGQVPTQLEVPQATNDEVAKETSAGPSSETPESPSTPHHKAVKEHARQNLADVSRVASWTTTIVTKPLPPALANIPLLNLTGPPSDGESDAEGGTSPKKKRKRRKKKKHHNVSNTPEA